MEEGRGREGERMATGGRTGEKVGGREGGTEEGKSEGLEWNEKDSNSVMVATAPCVEDITPVCPTVAVPISIVG